MLAELFGSALLGLVIALGALRWLSDRLPQARLVLATGATAAAAGGVITRAVLGDGHLAVALALAALVATALLSLLLDGRAATDRSRTSAAGSLP